MEPVTNVGGAIPIPEPSTELIDFVTDTDTAGKILQVTEHIYALLLFATTLGIAVGVCYLLYKAIKNFY